jgi:hypothetical protein
MANPQPQSGQMRRVAGTAATRDYDTLVRAHVTSRAISGRPVRTMRARTFFPPCITAEWSPLPNQTRRL